MGKYTLLKLLLFSMILFHGSDASFVRKLVDSTIKDSPVPIEKKPDPNNTVSEEKNKEENTTVPIPQPLPKVDTNNGGNQNQTNSTTNTPPLPVPVSDLVPVPATPPPPVPATAPPPVPKKADEKGHEEEKGKNEGIKFSHATTNDTCEGQNTCRDEGNMLACISLMDSKYFVVLLQNRGDGTIKVKLRSDFDSNLGDVDVDKNKTEKVTIKRIGSESDQLTLNAGKGDCVLHTTTPIPEAGSFFLHLPSYDKILTPVNGAYFLILNVLVFGGIWGCCCMFRKKRNDEIPYQELEMALPESMSATNVESAEGWDQVWDDDWDDNVAVKSPSVRVAGSISANGLTSRSLNKDGWEDNWDD